MLGILRSSAFRIILTYILLFGMSVAMLLIFIHFATIREMESQIKHTINIQIADLGRTFIREGSRRTATEINHLIRKDRQQTSIYLLLNKNWSVIAGNIDRWPGGETDKKDWITFRLESPADEEGPGPRVLAINSTLPEGYILLVGQKLTNIEKVEQIMLRVLQISIILTIVLALLGGLILFRNITGRLEIINQTCRKVMAGEMSQRVRVTGSGDEFDHLAENFNAMLARITELIESIRDMSNNVAHDLRTPLNHLRIRLEKLRQQNLSADQLQKEMQAAIQEVDALVATFNAILRISEVEAGAGMEQFAEVNLSEVLAGVVDLYDAWAEAKSIRIECDIEPARLMRGDRHLLTQAFANLLDNAIKYSPDNEAVHLTLSQQGDALTVTLSDQGPGIPENYHERVREKFFRLESSRTSPGSGLGLSLANAVFRLHRGEMVFTDNMPGLKVRIKLLASGL